MLGFVPRIALFLMMLAGCGAAGSKGDLGPGGGALDVQPTEYDAIALTQTVLTDGAPLHLVEPPQAGFVAFVGVRVGNASERTVQLTGRLRDLSGALVASDARTVTLQPAPDDATTLEPDLRSISTVSNITLCPSQTTTDRYDHPFMLEVEIKEPTSGRSGLATRRVTLVCGQSDPKLQTLCKCECAANYTLGKCAM